MAHIDQLSSGSLGAFKNLLANSLNAESAEQLGAKPYERSEIYTIIWTLSFKEMLTTAFLICSQLFGKIESKEACCTHLTA